MIEGRRLGEEMASGDIASPRHALAPSGNDQFWKPVACTATTCIAKVDLPWLRLMVNRASAYDLFPSREIWHAVPERAPTFTAVAET